MARKKNLSISSFLININEMTMGTKYNNNSDSHSSQFYTSSSFHSQQYSNSLSLSRVLFSFLLLFHFIPSCSAVLFIPSNNNTYQDRSASFGPKVNETGHLELLVPLAKFNSSNFLGCSDMEEYPVSFIF